MFILGEDCIHVHESTAKLHVSRNEWGHEYVHPVKLHSSESDAAFTRRSALPHVFCLNCLEVNRSD